MKELLTFCGQTFCVDDEDYEKAAQYKWYLKNKLSPHRYVYTRITGKTCVFYKDIIWGAKFALSKNQNPLDLRKENFWFFDTRSEMGTMLKIFRKKNPDFNPEISRKAQGKGTRTKFRYIGIRCDLPNNPHPWHAIIKYKGKNVHLGSYIKEEYAALAYDHKAYELYGPAATVNFPELTENEVKEKLEQIKATDAVEFVDMFSKIRQGKRLKNITKTSKFIGVSLKKGRARNKWRATIFFRNKQKYLGCYETEKEAAIAYDKKAVELFGENAKTNFP